MVLQAHTPGCIPYELHAEGVPGNLCGAPKIVSVQHEPKPTTKEIASYLVLQANYSRITQIGIFSISFHTKRRKRA